MTSKERAALRGQANSLNVLFQVGKGGISENLIEETNDALKARELIKLRVLTETSPVSAREAAEEIASKTASEVVQVIGGVMVLYKYNPELHKKAAVKKAPAKKSVEKKRSTEQKNPRLRIKRAETNVLPGALPQRINDEAYRHFRRQLRSRPFGTREICEFYMR